MNCPPSVTKCASTGLRLPNVGEVGVTSTTNAVDAAAIDAFASGFPDASSGSDAGSIAPSKRK